MFEYTEETTLLLEHSLISVSKWESKHKKYFINNNDLNTDEIVDYIKCMTITPNVDPNVYTRLTGDNIKLVRNYIDDPMTATTFNKENIDKLAMSNGGNGQAIITSEIVYYWMVALQIPFECQKWHLNRLLAFIQVCNIKQSPPTKMPKNEALAQRRALNKARRAKHNTKG